MYEMVLHDLKEGSLGNMKGVHKINSSRRDRILYNDNMI